LFGGWLARVRRARGLSQKELAGCLGYSVDLVRSLETRGQRPSGDFARQLAGFLKLPEERQDAFVIAARSGGPLPAWVDVLVSAPPGTRPVTNLPASPGPLIGREAALAAACCAPPCACSP
jgi:transcriptional regulator with XRE-family HTH domain